MHIAENLSTLAEEQLLCKTLCRGSKLFWTNHFFAAFDKVSDETKPHNIPNLSITIKNKKFRVNRLEFQPSFIVKLLYYSFCNRVERVLLENKVNFTNLVLCSLYWLLS